MSDSNLIPAPIPAPAPFDAAPARPARRRRDQLIARLLLAYLGVIIGLLTLSPFRFAASWDGRMTFFSDLWDVPANIALFVPIGFLFQLAIAPTRAAPIRLACLAGAVFSLCLESLQLFLPDRSTSVFDVLSNTTGSGVGALLCQRVQSLLDRRLPDALLLDHPLVNVLYLLLPLMWLSGLDIAATPTRAWLLAPLGATGALVFAGLWRFRVVALTRHPTATLCAAVGAWFALGSLTVVRQAPLAVCAGACALLVLAAVAGHARDTPRERRFEATVLAWAWPWFGAYLLLLVLLPFSGFRTSFAFTAGYPEWTFHRPMTLRIAEQIGALTALGYVLAGALSRRPARTPLRLWLGCVMVATGLELLHGFLPDARASGLRCGLTSAGAAFGIALHALQLNVVRLLRGSRRSGGV
ncbi:MAG: VanZ family protein [Gammaproteobacteria bacterium]